MAKRKTKPKTALREYRRKRDFAATPEPAPRDGAEAEGGRFVVQEHHARRLHWDLRLERDGALASWAVPNGIPDDPQANRKAVRTEDHPLEYIDFAGEIPAGEYGAGTMTIWDRGTYECHKFREDEVIITFHGERLQGRYALFRAGGDPKDWMIHRMDPPADPEREPMPEQVVPMMAKLARTLPRAAAEWGYEVKWDGVRAIAYCEPGRLELRSRTGNDITGRYPEVRGLREALGARPAMLDGEIVAFGDDGRPSFERLQRRMHVESEGRVARLAKAVPVVYVVFDLLHLDGRSLLDLPYTERRERLEELGLVGPAWQVPAWHREGPALRRATQEQGLEGVVAKRLDSCYEPGRRSGAWVKVKNLEREVLVIGGWLPGEGRRTERIGALLVGERDDEGSLRYAGRVGTGFKERDLAELAERLRPLRRDQSPFARGRPPRGSVFVEPELSCVVEFREWTAARTLRAPSYKGLVASETGGLVASETGGREVKISNRGKVLYPSTGFTKGEVVDYYQAVASAILPHLRERPVTLKRYPDGVEAEFFYEKQCPSHRPDWVATAAVPSRERGKIDFCLANDLPTLTWLANLAALELHTSLSLAGRIDRPTTMVFDLDPGPGADVLDCAEVALWLRDVFTAFELQTFVKTSGSKGLHAQVPLNTEVTYADTKPFAKAVAELLEKHHPERVVSRMTKSLRKNRVLVDWSQNDEHKTTVCAYSLRARERPTVSAPVAWEEIEGALAARDAARLVLDAPAVVERVEREGDPLGPALTLRQQLPRLGA